MYLLVLRQGNIRISIKFRLKKYTGRQQKSKIYMIDH
jgi:hypothetical protein